WNKILALGAASDQIGTRPITLIGRKMQALERIDTPGHWIAQASVEDMDQLTATAASGMRARLEALDLLANNISNSGTAGYKSDREFYNLYTSADSESQSTLPNI